MLGRRICQKDRRIGTDAPGGSLVGQLGKLRPIVNRPDPPGRTGQRRLPTAAQAASPPHITLAIPLLCRAAGEIIRCGTAVPPPTRSATRPPPARPRAAERWPVP